jgi:hypothetical protein
MSEAAPKPASPRHRYEPTPAVNGRIQRELDERRFAALVAAVRAHQARGTGAVTRARPHDRALYGRLRDLAAAPAPPAHFSRGA